MVAAAFECIRATDLHNLHRFLLAGLRDLRRPPLRGSPATIDFEDRIQFETVGQHNDRLRPTLAFIHCKTDSLGPVCEQSAAKASPVPDDPLPASILPDE